MDQQLGVIGWVPPKDKGEAEQPRWRQRVDIDEVLSDAQTSTVLGRWWSARMHEAPAYSGGVLDAWPSLMVDGLAVCRAEEQAIDAFLRWEELHHG